jgi:hypothetical protein
MVKDVDHGEKGSGARVEHINNGMSGWVLVSSWFEMSYRIQAEINA